LTTPPPSCEGPRLANGAQQKSAPSNSRRPTATYTIPVRATVGGADESLRARIRELNSNCATVSAMLHSTANKDPAEYARQSLKRGERMLTLLSLEE